MLTIFSWIASMNSRENSATRDLGAPFGPPVAPIVFGLVVAHAVCVIAAYVMGVWLVRPDGSPIVSDFLGFWSAGRVVLDADDPARAYAWEALAAAQVAGIGRPIETGYPHFFYPPSVLFVASIVALLPYVPAFAAWSIGTLALYAVAVRAIVGRDGFLLACAFPAVLANFMAGQNGFITATLLAGTLGFMERWPVLAGCCLGLLTYKPQFGILFPIVLAVAGRWRVFFAATATALLLVAASWLILGGHTWGIFLRDLAESSRIHLTTSGEHWAKMQSVFTLMRWLGGGEGLAWTIYGLFAGMLALLVGRLWRSEVPFNLKAAALGLGALLASPYVFMYDLVALAVPLAFLIREARRTGFLPYEMAAIGVACLLILVFPIVTAPLGLAATLIVAALVARRALSALRPTSPLAPRRPHALAQAGGVTRH